MGFSIIHDDPIDDHIVDIFIVEGISCIGIDYFLEFMACLAIKYFAPNKYAAHNQLIDMSVLEEVNVLSKHHSDCCVYLLV